ncbi:MAG: nucleoside triphosphate pyrophosphohydrolase family protein [Desulfuromonadaceae bacterium]
MTYLTEEIGELAEAISEYEYQRGGRRDHVAREAIQAAVLCLKLAEMYLNIEASRGSDGV